MTWLLSPEAAKAQREGAARARGYQAQLARTGDKAIVTRPYYGGRSYQGRFAKAMTTALPQFEFDSKHNWWAAPLDELRTAYDALQPVLLSDGACKWLYEENQTEGPSSTDWRTWLRDWAEDLDKLSWFDAMLARKVSDASDPQYTRKRWSDLEHLAHKYPQHARRLEVIAEEMRQEVGG